MGTKKRPGEFDCYAKAELDEPIFVLLARDEHAPEVVRYWTALKAKLLPVGFIPIEISPESRARYLTEQEREAMTCADDMREWRKKNRP
jgi:hypothetical protein